MPPKGHLPFDLHVLGLPLAFILSQDQTLHCKFDISFLLLSVLSNLSARIDKVLFCTSLPFRLCLDHSFKELAKPCLFFQHISPSFCECKGTKNSLHTTLFITFFWKIFTFLFIRWLPIYYKSVFPQKNPVLLPFSWKNTDFYDFFDGKFMKNITKSQKTQKNRYGTPMLLTSDRHGSILYLHESARIVTKRVSSQQPMANSQQSTVNSQQPTANSQ